jgi:DNA-binding transcriptional regulator LsrR (DeoR family)
MKDWNADRVDIYDYQEARLFNQLLHLYYVDGMTQAQIARNLGLSTAKVNRLLQQARRNGMVEIKLLTPLQHLRQLEQRLETILGVTSAVVIPAIEEGGTTMVNSLGRVGANYLLEHLRDGDVIGITGGTAVHDIVTALESPRAFDVTVVPLLGAVQGRVLSDVNYLASQLADRLGGKAFQLHAPAFAETPEHRDSLLSMRPIKAVVDIARRATVALVGIGRVDHERSRFLEFPTLSAEDMRHIAEHCRGAAEVAAYALTIDGKSCAQEYAERVVGLTLREIRQIPLIIGAAATRDKARPIYAALRGGFLHTLITDESAALRILEIFEEELRPSPSFKRLIPG